MSRTTPRHWNFSALLLTHARNGRRTPDERVSGAFLACEKLRPHPVTWTGSAGFRTPLRREGRPRVALYEGDFFNIIAGTPGCGKTVLPYPIIFAHAGPS